VAQAETGAEAEEQGLGAALVSQLSQGLTGLGAIATEVVDQLGDPGRAVAWLSAQAREPERRAFWLQVAWTVGAVFGAGLLAHLLVRSLLARPGRAVVAREPADRLARLRWFAVRIVLEALPVAGFAFFAIGALLLVRPQETVRLLSLVVVNAAVASGVIRVLARTLFSPLAPALRPVRLSDDWAAYLFVWSTRFAAVVVYGYFLVQAAALLGVEASGQRILGNLVAGVATVLAVIVILQVRGSVAGWARAASGRLRGPRTLGLVLGRLGEVWHVLAVAYVLVAYVVWVLGIEGGFLYVARGTLGTVAAAVLGRLATRAAGRAIGRLFRVSPDLRLRYPDLEARVNRYQPVARGIAAALIGVAVVLAALEAWGLDAVALLGSETGRDLVARLLRIAYIVLLAVFAAEAARIVVARRLASSQGVSAAGRSQRLRTLLPLARSAIVILVFLIATMTVLSELGVHIGPLLAGAGVIGLAIGFGAQALVKDVITGAFILFEDAISVGDIVEVAGHTGVVEAISIRTIRHRDLAGVVHVIPFSSVDVVRNYTRQFNWYLMDIGVAYREDTDDVVAVMREVLDEMREDPRFAPSILQPLEVMGVNSFDDSAVAIRARIKTVPLDKWRVGREYLRRLKHAFDARGIEIPFPHRTVYFGVDKDGTAPPARLRMEGAEPPDVAAARADSGSRHRDPPSGP
jgi:small-conductance mechanosensitive channel